LLSTKIDIKGRFIFYEKSSKYSMRYLRNPYLLSGGIPHLYTKDAWGIKLSSWRWGFFI
jgi:hypothetical protein